MVELISIDYSRVTRLFALSRPDGWPFMPAVAHALVQKYKFGEAPASVQDFKNDSLKFGVGEFNGAPIDEFAIYSDGVIAKGRTDSDNLLGFLDDVIDLAAEAGFKAVETHDIHTLFESNIMVRSSTELLKVLEAVHPISKALAKAFHEATGAKHHFDYAGIALGADPRNITTLRPSAFRVDRRSDIEFEKLFYASLAPLPTKKHVALLSALEELYR